jgi:two-component sensor histidine kinase
MYVHQEDRARLLELLNKQDIINNFEAEIRRRDNAIIWISMDVKAIRDQCGKIILLEGTIEDITERKRAEEKIRASLLEKETMLREIHHRVKNNLQVISSLLGLQSGYVQDEQSRKIFQESMGRVSTMAKIHTMLYQSADMSRVDFGGFIRDLASRLQQSSGTAGSPVGVNVNVSDVSLTIETSIPCGLILNELVSNSLKHAFPEGRGGEVNISMTKVEDRFVLAVQDNGIGFPAAVDFQNTKSLGLELVNLLVGQINGSIELHVEGGTTFTITFPAVSKRG